MAYKGIATYQYDNNGSLLTETTTQLDYISEQVLTADPSTGLPLLPQVKSYSYNAFKQNISVTNADGSFQQNIYDALGLRISTIENGYCSDYIFDRGSIIAELDGSGTLTSRNIRGYGLLAQKDDKGRLNYYLHNAHGDITSLINASGKVLNSYQYDAFGNTTSSVEAVINRFKYAGEQLDTITGQYYLRARYYDPTVGRFTQEDTYRGDGLNLYSYVANNPVKYVDPSGHCKDEMETAVNNHLLNNPNAITANDAAKMIDSILAQYHCGFWNGGGYFLIEDSYAYFWYEQLKNEVASYKFKTSALNVAIVPTTIFDSYKFVQDMGGAAPQYAIPLTALVSIAKLSDHFLGTKFNADDGYPDTAGTIKITQDWLKESKDVATALVKFNYIMGSDYRYLMLGFEGRGEFMEQLDKLKGKLQNQNFSAYSGSEKEAYRIAMIGYVNEIYDMNKNFYANNKILKEQLQQLERSVSSVDARAVNEQLSK